jgi:hypothetical protein
MTTRCAVIKDAVVVNVVRCDPASDAVSGFDVVPSEVAQIGDAYDAGANAFSRPPPPPITLEDKKAELVALVTKQRQMKEVAGCLYEGNMFYTDNDSQVKFLGILLTAITDPSFSTTFKTMSGAFVHLNNDDIRGVSQAVRQHIQSCYEEEAYLLYQVNNATTMEQLTAIEMVLAH